MRSLDAVEIYDSRFPCHPFWSFRGGAWRLWGPGSSRRWRWRRSHCPPPTAADENTPAWRMTGRSGLSRRPCHSQSPGCRSPASGKISSDTPVITAGYSNPVRIVKASVKRNPGPSSLIMNSILLLRQMQRNQNLVDQPNPGKRHDDSAKAIDQTGCGSASGPR